jgi:hypothetical protein
MEKKIDAVKLMREIRLKLGEKYSISREEEMRDLEKKFGYLKKARLSGGGKTGGRKAAGTAD